MSLSLVAYMYLRFITPCDMVLATAFAPFRKSKANLASPTVTVNAYNYWISSWRDLKLWSFGRGVCHAVVDGSVSPTDLHHNHSYNIGLAPHLMKRQKKEDQVSHAESSGPMWCCDHDAPDTPAVWESL